MCDSRRYDTINNSDSLLQAGTQHTQTKRVRERGCSGRERERERETPSQYTKPTAKLSVAAATNEKGTAKQHNVIHSSVSAMQCEQVQRHDSDTHTHSTPAASSTPTSSAWLLLSAERSWLSPNGQCQVAVHPHAVRRSADFRIPPTIAAAAHSLTDTGDPTAITATRITRYQHGIRIDAEKTKLTKHVTGTQQPHTCNHNNIETLTFVSPPALSVR